MHDIDLEEVVPELVRRCDDDRDDGASRRGGTLAGMPVRNSSP